MCDENDASNCLEEAARARPSSSTASPSIRESNNLDIFHGFPDLEDKTTHSPVLGVTEEFDRTQTIGVVVPVVVSVVIVVIIMVVTAILWNNSKIRKLEERMVNGKNHKVEEEEMEELNGAVLTERGNSNASAQASSSNIKDKKDSTSFSSPLKEVDDTTNSNTMEDKENNDAKITVTCQDSSDHTCVKIAEVQPLQHQQQTEND